MNNSTVNTPKSLHTLYFTRSAVQLLWAVAVMVATRMGSPLAGVLLILYPLWDVACTVYEIRSSGSQNTTQTFNAVAGIITASAIALTIFTHEEFAIAAFGGWAFVAGLLQVVVALTRRKQLGGQWAMILSGAQSLLAGLFFIAGGLAMKTHTKDIAGYAIFGAVYFFIGALLLLRKLPKVSPVA